MYAHVHTRMIYAHGWKTIHAILTSSLEINVLRRAGDSGHTPTMAMHNASATAALLAGACDEPLDEESGGLSPRVLMMPWALAMRTCIPAVLGGPSLDVRTALPPVDKLHVAGRGREPRSASAACAPAMRGCPCSPLSVPSPSRDLAGGATGVRGDQPQLQPHHPRGGLAAQEHVSDDGASVQTRMCPQALKWSSRKKR